MSLRLRIFLLSSLALLSVFLRLALASEQFFLAARDGNIAELDKLLREGNPNNLLTGKHEHGNTALIVAIQSGEVECAKLLIERSANIPGSLDIQNDQGTTGLIQASALGDAESVRALLQHHADVNIVDRNGNNALILAAIDGRSDVVNLLLEHNKTNLNHQSKNGKTALIRACTSGYKDIVSNLLSQGADPNLVDEEGFSAIFFAVFANYFDIVAELLRRGADPNLLSIHGDSALLWAVYKGHTDIAIYLLENGSKSDVPATDGRTPLTYACASSNHELLDVLVAHGARNPPLVKTWREGESICDVGYRLTFKFMNAIIDGRLKTATKLLQENSEILNLNYQDELGDTPLLWASHNNYTEIVTLLVDKGADINIVNSYGESALWYACYNDNLMAIQRLVAAGAEFPAKERTTGYSKCDDLKEFEKLQKMSLSLSLSQSQAQGHENHISASSTSSSQGTSDEL